MNSILLAGVLTVLVVEQIVEFEKQRDFEIQNTVTGGWLGLLASIKWSTESFEYGGLISSGGGSSSGSRNDDWLFNKRLAEDEQAQRNDRLREEQQRMDERQSQLWSPDQYGR